MRTNMFTFKKTKRVKVVTEYPAICVDLTKEEASALADIIEEGSTVGWDPDESDDVGVAMEDLYRALKAFAENDV